MKQHLTIMLFSFVGICSGQDYLYSRIPGGFVMADENYRTGSCTSPSGRIVCAALMDYPTFAYLTDNGCCNPINPSVKNATYYYTMTSPGTTSTFDAGFTYVAAGGFPCGFSILNCLLAIQTAF